MSSSFTFYEITGPDLRVFSFFGASVPSRGVKWEGKQRVEKIVYQGNPNASLQVLGPEELPTVIRGWWKDVHLNNQTEPCVEVDGQQIFTADELSQLVDDVRCKGQTIEVRWRHLVRRGILARFSQTWHTDNDLEYEIEFEFSGKGESDEPGPTARSGLDISSLVESTESDFDRVAIASRPEFPRDVSLSEKLNVGLKSIADSVDGLSDSVANTLSGTMEPIDAARRSVGLLNTISAEFDELIFEVYQTTDAASVASSDIRNVSPGQALFAASANRQMVQELRRNRHATARRASEQARTIDPSLVDVIFAKEGQDFRDVSRTYYGVADHWSGLMRFNDATSSRLVAGQLVMIPQKPPRP